jgi:hypothetical protein
MDEFFSIEANVGEVKAIMGMQYTDEKQFVRDEDQEFEVFPEEPVEEVKVKTGEEEEEEEPAAQEDDGEIKKPVFKKEDFNWTVSNRKPKNLPQLYQGQKGINSLNELKQAKDFGASRGEQVSKALDDFCSRLYDSDNQDKFLYWQVIFEGQQSN